MIGKVIIGVILAHIIELVGLTTIGIIFSNKLR